LTVRKYRVPGREASDKRCSPLRWRGVDKPIAPGFVAVLFMSSDVGRKCLYLGQSCGTLVKKGGFAMKTVVIAMERGSFAREVKRELRGLCRVLTVDTGGALERILEAERPQGLILDLHLPGLDPVGFLRAWGRKLRVLAVCRFLSGYLMEALGGLGLSYLLVRPCLPQTVAARTGEMLLGTEPETGLRELLLRLSIPLDFLGGRCLLRAIPRMEGDPTQSLTGSLYPAVGEELGLDWHLVERDIRYAVARGWERGNRELWLRHFPGGKPKNGEFIARMAELDRGLAPEPGIESANAG